MPLDYHDRQTCTILHCTHRDCQLRVREAQVPDLHGQESQAPGPQVPGHHDQPSFFLDPNVQFPYTESSDVGRAFGQEMLGQSIVVYDASGRFHHVEHRSEIAGGLSSRVFHPQTWYGYASLPPQIPRFQGTSAQDSGLLLPQEMNSTAALNGLTHRFQETQAQETGIIRPQETASTVAPSELRRTATFQRDMDSAARQRDSILATARERQESEASRKSEVYARKQSALRKYRARVTATRESDSPSSRKTVKEETSSRTDEAKTYFKRIDVDVSEQIAAVTTAATPKTPSTSPILPSPTDPPTFPIRHRDIGSHLLKLNSGVQNLLSKVKYIGEEIESGLPYPPDCHSRYQKLSDGICAAKHKLHYTQTYIENLIRRHGSQAFDEMEDVEQRMTRLDKLGKATEEMRWGVDGHQKEVEELGESVTALVRERNAKIAMKTKAALKKKEEARKGMKAPLKELQRVDEEEERRVEAEQLKELERIVMGEKGKGKNKRDDVVRVSQDTKDKEMWGFERIRRAEPKTREEREFSHYTFLQKAEKAAEKKLSMYYASKGFESVRRGLSSDQPLFVRDLDAWSTVCNAGSDIADEDVIQTAPTAVSDFPARRDLLSCIRPVDVALSTAPLTRDMSTNERIRAYKRQHRSSQEPLPQLGTEHQRSSSGMYQGLYSNISETWPSSDTRSTRMAPSDCSTTPNLDLVPGTPPDWSRDTRSEDMAKFLADYRGRMRKPVSSRQPARDRTPRDHDAISRPLTAPASPEVQDGDDAVVTERIEAVQPLEAPSTTPPSEPHSPFPSPPPAPASLAVGDVDDSVVTEHIEKVQPLEAPTTTSPFDPESPFPTSPPALASPAVGDVGYAVITEVQSTTPPSDPDDSASSPSSCNSAISTPLIIVSSPSSSTVEDVLSFEDEDDGDMTGEGAEVEHTEMVEVNADAANDAELQDAVSEDLGEWEEVEEWEAVAPQTRVRRGAFVIWEGAMGLLRGEN